MPLSMYVYAPAAAPTPMFDEGMMAAAPAAVDDAAAVGGFDAPAAGAGWDGAQPQAGAGSEW